MSGSSAGFVLWVLGALVIVLGLGVFFFESALVGAAILAVGALIAWAGSRLGLRTCPWCAKRIAPEAMICPHCQRSLIDAKPTGKLPPWEKR